MIEIKVDRPTVTYLKNNKAKISFVVEQEVLPIFNGLNKKFNLKIEEYSPKRSQSQNAYMWTLLDEIAKVIHETKDDVYKRMIKDYGVFQSLTLQSDAVNSFIKDWKAKGIGWFCQIKRRDKAKNETDIIAYYGSSSYNTREMARLIDAIIMECKNLDIPVISFNEAILLDNENDNKIDEENF